MSLPEIPGYRILRQISEGKRSRLYLAEQESLARQVALKVLSDEFYRDPAFKKRFIDEGKSAAQLNHPNILAVFDIGSVAGFPYIATEYLPGGTLRDRLQAPLPPESALRVAREIAAALEFSHRHGIAHRDIKPVNIMFRVDGSAVLADPGVVSAAEQNNRLSIGSPHYMSPEQIQAQPVDARSDFYTLGVVLYEMLVGHCPYDHEDPFQVAGMHLSEPIPRLPESLARFQPLLDRLLAKEAADRPADAQALIAGLDALAGGDQRPAAPAASRPLPVAPAAGTASAAATPATMVMPAAAGYRTEASSAARPASPPASDLAATTTMPKPTLVVDREEVRRPEAASADRPAAVKARRPKPRWPALLAILLLLAAAIVALWWLLSGSEPPAPADRPGEARPQAAQLSGGQAAGSVAPEVAQWIKRAEEQIGRLQYLSPEEGNAAQSYLRALQLDPANAQARQGLEQVVSKVEETVRALLADGEYDKARLTLDLAKRYFPEREVFKLLERSLPAQ